MFISILQVNLGKRVTMLFFADKGPNEPVHIVYVPSHLYHMLFELFKVFNQFPGALHSTLTRKRKSSQKFERDSSHKHENQVIYLTLCCYRYLIFFPPLNTTEKFCMAA